jgi:ketosteroid isomerase-like protein
MEGDLTIETIRRSYEAMVNGDVATLMAQFAEDCTWHEAPLISRTRGAQGTRRNHEHARLPLRAYGGLGQVHP